MSRNLGNRARSGRSVIDPFQRVSRHLRLAAFVLLVATLGTVSAAQPCGHAVPAEALSGRLSLRYWSTRRAETRVRFELMGIDAKGKAQAIGRAEYPVGTGADIPFSIPIDTGQARRFDRYRLTILVAEDPAFEAIVSTTSFDLTAGQLGTFLNLAIQPTPRPVP